jgi:hypothetical protein
MTRKRDKFEEIGSSKCGMWGPYRPKLTVHYHLLASFSLCQHTTQLLRLDCSEADLVPGASICPSFLHPANSRVSYFFAHF